jgi:hypothetical protein
MFCNLTHFSLKNAREYTTIYVCDVLWALANGSKYTQELHEYVPPKLKTAKNLVRFEDIVLSPSPGSI